MFGRPDSMPEPQAFCDSITADHKILNDDDQSRSRDQITLVVQDRYSSWLQGYASETKNTNDTKKGLTQFSGPLTKIKHAYTDNSKELDKACDELEIPHDTSTPHRPQTNGVAERAVRRVKEGTACTLTQSGFLDVWWAEAMACYCFLRNVVDVLACGRTPWHKRFGRPFKGPIIPFGAEVQYKPITAKDKDRLHAMGSQLLSGVFV